MRRGTQVAILAILLATLGGTVARGAPPKPASGRENKAMEPTLRALAEKRGLLIGAAVDAEALRKEPAYRETLAREFSILTPENAMKFGAIQPDRERYTFEDAEAIVAFARAHGMKVRGHTLVWHYSLPKWVNEEQLSHAELAAVMHEHIRTEVTHFRGKVYAWDVVNEALNDDGTLRDTIWRRALGPDYLAQVFQWAHEADPKAKLFYNDYSAEGMDARSDTVYALVQGLKERGVPIHGVGLQMHLLGPPPPAADLAANIKRLGALGLEVHVTELDVAIQDIQGTEAEKLAEQARIYREVLETCLSQPACKAFVMWGFTDAHTWIPWFTKHPDAPLIFDAMYQPKPAYFAMREALAK